MNLNPESDELLEVVRASAGAGAWLDVRGVLSRHPEVERRTDLMLLLAEASYRTGAPVDACTWFERALPILQTRGDRPAVRTTINRLGATYFELGNLLGAEQCFARALELGRVDDDQLLVARSTNNLGLVANVRGRREEALATYQLAIPAYQRLGHVQGLAESHHNMAISYRDLGDLERADEHERRAIEYALRLPDLRLEALGRLGRAEVLLRRDELVVAEATARRAADMFAQLPDPGRQADALRLVGIARAGRGQVDAAAAALDQAVELAHAHASSLVEAESLSARAELRATMGAHAGALDDAERALVLFERLQAATEVERVRQWLSAQRGAGGGEA